MQSVGRSLKDHLDDLRKSHEEAKQREEEKKRQAQKELERKEAERQITLPLWPETIRGIPNSVLRSSLFAAIQGKHRRYFNRVIIIDEKDLKIRFTGMQLNQSDLTVWETALHIGRVQELGYELLSTEYGFLKTMKRSIGKAQREWLRTTLARLGSSLVEITHNGLTYGGSLLEFERDEHTGRIKIIINPKIGRLYTAGWTYNEFQNKEKIGNKPLALWLYGYVSSHAKIYATKIETYHRLSGSDNKSMRDFKRKFEKAALLLKEQDIIKDFYFDKNGLACIENIPSASQKRYLENHNA